MKDPDLDYLCTILGNLCGIPVRIYCSKSRLFYHSLVHLPADPIALCENEVLDLKQHIAYYVTPDNYFYGIVNHKDKALVIGPSGQITAADQPLREQAFRLGIPSEDVPEYIKGMKSIVPMPAASLMLMLCSINYMLNGEKKTLEDITIIEAEQQDLNSLISKQQARERFEDKAQEGSPTYNAYDIEQHMLSLVRKGDSAALKEWLANAPAVRGGSIAADQMRQIKNTFVVSATLVSRAAIQGGMDISDAFALSDSFIQRCELLSEYDRIINLQYSMVLEFARRVESIRHGKELSKLAIDVANYVQHHISERISAEDIAKELYMSRPYLSKRFKEETGESLTDYILREKTEEAKRLIRWSDRSLTEISVYLGFSSQSHFSKVFMKYAGMTPKDYRSRH